MSDDEPKIKINETVTLRKFEGDDQTGEPLETIIIQIVDGVEVSRQVITKGDQNGTH